MLLQGAQSHANLPPHAHASSSSNMRPGQGRKRKAETQDNERLSKRLSLLNLEQNGQKLYIPVESPTPPSPAPGQWPPPQAAALNPPPPQTVAQDDGDAMRVDDMKHKVYIYSLDDELSASDSEPDEARLVFLPDIDRHLRSRRIGFSSPAAPSIPRPVPPAPDGDFSDMQLVLYRDPTSLSVPAEQDGVRRAILESRARARAREQQRRERDGMAGFVEMPPPTDAQVAGSSDSMDVDMDID
ncbi:hypothetical protein SODALDRAFT_375756 [Sodiomyces alkalinus F11]|uniref:Uncharacterized protein n=1 Tax=Sodiomyces alkalinus (strain CBS 110278 / VKM F-3762 / F11) TaxID=1314773 RepID=A0A3N2QA08_SODAK|nr:hypothetical protein SODALDRAFT_375756 [Sodiomyces alkalinus F11]ROT43604.1 hypothetical protein SODALDRAFT_375756 [Sodiomyces alkalinus F11]